MLLEICGGKYAKYTALCAVCATTTAGIVSGNPALIAVGLEADIHPTQPLNVLKSMNKGPLRAH